MNPQQSPYSGPRSRYPQTPFKSLNPTTPAPNPRQFGLTPYIYPNHASPITPAPLPSRPSQTPFHQAALTRTNTSAQPPDTSNQHSNSWEASFIFCNRCLKPISEQRNVMTPCYHVFCVTCANQSFSKPVQNASSTPTANCPVCNCAFNPLSDVSCIASSDADAKALAKKCCTFSPRQLLEIFTYAMKFWQFQQQFTTKQKFNQLQAMLMELQQPQKLQHQHQAEFDQLKSQFKQQYDELSYSHKELNSNYQSMQSRCEQQEQYINKLKSQLQMTTTTSSSEASSLQSVPQSRYDSLSIEPSTQQRSYHNPKHSHMGGYLNNPSRIEHGKAHHPIILFDDDTNNQNINHNQTAGSRNQTTNHYQRASIGALPISTRGLLGDRGGNYG